MILMTSENMNISLLIKDFQPFFIQADFCESFIVMEYHIHFLLRIFLTFLKFFYFMPSLLLEDLSLFVHATDQTFEY